MAEGSIIIFRYNSSLMIRTLSYILFFTSSISLCAQSLDLGKIADSINVTHLKEKIYFLASDSLQGRKTYEKGQKIAAQYISESFGKYNLKPFDGTNNYFQILTRYRLKACFSHIRKKEDVGKKIGFPVSYSYGSLPYIDTSVVDYVFAGRATDKDLTGLDIENKALVFFVDSLMEGIQKVNQLSNKFPNSSFVLCMNGKRNYPLLTNIFKVKPLKLGEVKSFKDLSEYHSRLYWGELAKEDLDDAEFIDNKLDSSRKIGFSVINEETLEQVFGTKAKKLYIFTRKNRKARLNLLTKIPNVEVKQSINYFEKIDTLTTENVIACVEGTDKKEEAIIITAHYDHVGNNYNGGLCLGADDNASGTAALIEIAGAYAKAAQNGLRPKRTVIFIAFTGEEEGLVGSWHYVNHPLFPLEKTICNINMDMVGRNHKDKEKNKYKVFLVGRNHDKNNRKKTFKKVNKTYNLLTLDTHPPFIHKIMWMFGSDHHAFQMKDVPSNVIFTGDHDDYHTPRDTPDKINFQKLSEIAKLVFLSSWEMANQ